MDHPIFGVKNYLRRVDQPISGVKNHLSKVDQPIFGVKNRLSRVDQPIFRVKKWLSKVDRPIFDYRYRTVPGFERSMLSRTSPWCAEAARLHQGLVLFSRF
jgi:hypothetical protein